MLRNSLSTPLNTRTKYKHAELGIVGDNKVNAIWVPIIQNIDYTNHARWILCSGIITLGTMYSSSNYNSIDFIEYGFSHTHTCGRIYRITSKNTLNQEIPYVSCQVTPLIYNNVTKEMGFFILDDFYYLNNVRNVPVSIEVKFNYNNLSNKIINNITPISFYSEELLDWYKRILNGHIMNGSGMEQWAGDSVISAVSSYAPSDTHCLYMNSISENLEISIPKFGYSYIQITTIANGCSSNRRNLVDLETNVFWGTLSELITYIKNNWLRLANVNVASDRGVTFFEEVRMSFVSEDERSIKFKLNAAGNPASIPDNLIKIIGIPNTAEYNGNTLNLTPIFQKLIGKKTSSK